MNEYENSHFNCSCNRVGFDWRHLATATISATANTSDQYTSIAISATADTSDQYTSIAVATTADTGDKFAVTAITAGTDAREKFAAVKGVKGSVLTT